MKYFVLRNAHKWATIAGMVCWVLAATIWLEGAQQSRGAQIKAENLDKEYAGGNWIPASGNNYYLEASIVGHDEWSTKTLNVGYGDQVEFRIRIESGDEAPHEWVGLAMAYDTQQLTDITERDENGLRVHKVYDSPDIEHIAYVPVGTYAIKSNVWSNRTGAYYFGVTYNGTDELAYRRIFLVPPYSEVDFRIVRRFAIAGLICFLATVPIIWLQYRHEKRCYAWS